ncbi:MAG: hypothetical protein M1834_005597 [Cirrosporium novae-zelandiae]|nr:MAG: hypothetical protein M1834_005597 [Cirrosporium novae-zelandiae]
MDVVGSVVTILTLAQTVISICIKVRATCKSNSGFDTVFDSAILGAEVQVQRLVSWSSSFRAESCSDPLRDLLGRVLQTVEVEIKTIHGYIEKYMPGSDNPLSSLSIEERLDVSSLPTQKQTQFDDLGNTSIKKKGPSIINRFHYVISDKDRLLSHSAALEKAVDQLHALLPANRQLTLELKFLASLLKTDDIDELSAIASSTGSHSYQNIQSSASIKAARIRGEILPRSTNRMSKLLDCNRQGFSLERRWEGKDIGTYEGRKVLVEWKTCTDELSVEESTHRIADVARLLHQTGVTRPKDLIALDCLGYMKKPPSIGLVYALPLTYSERLPKSLFKLLLDKESDPSTWPSWEQRQKLAWVLARAVFQLHVVGWLHKGIRPQNIMFIGDGKSLKSPYLIGFDYARRGEYGEKTESTDPAFDLYRHPFAQGEARSKFQASFDLFALGLILLEIGIWGSLQDQRQPLENEFKGSSQDAQTKFHWLLMEGKGPLKHLPFYMGNKYYDAVKTCLSIDPADLTEDVYITDIIANLES